MDLVRARKTVWAEGFMLSAMLLYLHIALPLGKGCYVLTVAQSHSMGPNVRLVLGFCIWMSMLDGS